MSDEEPPIETRAKCPKCRSKDLALIETWDGASITWDVTGGKRPVNGWMQEGDATRLDGECAKCGHKWRFRVRQVTNLDVED